MTPQWQPIVTAPIGVNILMWWTPVDGNKYAESAIIGQISTYENGKYWDPFHNSVDYREGYKDLNRITHWQPLPPPPGEEPKCECWANPETGYLETCEKHNARPDPQPDALAELERWLKANRNHHICWLNQTEIILGDGWGEYAGTGSSFEANILAALGKAGAR